MSLKFTHGSQAYCNIITYITGFIVVIVLLPVFVVGEILVFLIIEKNVNKLT